MLVFEPRRRYAAHQQSDWDVSSESVDGFSPPVSHVFEGYSLLLVYRTNCDDHNLNVRVVAKFLTLSEFAGVIRK